jgi:hypothetical protein
MQKVVGSNPISRFAISRSTKPPGTWLSGSCRQHHVATPERVGDTGSMVDAIVRAHDDLDAALG